MLEPAAFEGFGGGDRVLEVAFHDDVAAHHDLAHGFAVLGDGFEGFGIGDGEGFLDGVVDALAGADGGLFGLGGGCSTLRSRHRR